MGITWKPKICESCGAWPAVWSFVHSSTPLDVPIPQSEAVLCDGCDAEAIFKGEAYSKGKRYKIGEYTDWRGCEHMDLVESLWYLSNG